MQGILGFTIPFDRGPSERVSPSLVLLACAASYVCCICLSAVPTASTGEEVRGPGAGSCLVVVLGRGLTPHCGVLRCPQFPCPMYRVSVLAVAPLGCADGC